MNNEEMFLTILNRMDSMETSLTSRMDNLETSLNGRMDNLETSLNGRMDKLENRMNELDGRMDKLESGLVDVNGRIDKLEFDLEVEIYAVKTETEKVYEIAQEQFAVLNNKFDNLMYTKDVVEYDKINIRFEALEKAYQKLMETNV